VRTHLKDAYGTLIPKEESLITRVFKKKASLSKLL